MTGSETFAKLSAPFAADTVSWRIGSTTTDKSKGMALAYIDSRDVMDRLNEVCGPLGWQCEHIVAPDGKKVTCRIGVKDPDSGEWIWRSDGAGETDVEGEKGSYSDSLKRAAVSFGVGRYLYDLASPWVEIEAAGRSFKIKESEKAKLRALLTKGGAASTAPKSEPTAAPAKPPAKSYAPENQAPVVTPEAPKAKITPAEWVAEQMIAIAAAKTPKDLMAWEQKNEKAILSLNSNHPDLHRQLLDYLMKQYDVVNPIGGG